MPTAATVADELGRVVGLPSAAAQKVVRNLKATWMIPVPPHGGKHDRAPDLPADQIVALALALLLPDNGPATHLADRTLRLLSLRADADPKADSFGDFLVRILTENAAEYWPDKDVISISHVGAELWVDVALLDEQVRFAEPPTILTSQAGGLVHRTIIQGIALSTIARLIAAGQPTE